MAPGITFLSRTSIDGPRVLGTDTPGDGREGRCRVAAAGFSQESISEGTYRTLLHGNRSRDVVQFFPLTS
jgi:hypothetical protein